MRILLIGLLTSMLMLAGCASISSEECMAANWRDIGYEDGAAGRDGSGFTRYRKACAEYGVTPVKKQYDAGYKEGVISYCTYGRGLTAGQQGYQFAAVCPASSEYARGHDEGLERFCSESSGYDYGYSGKTYRGVCPANSEKDFLIGYESGRFAYTQQQKYVRLDSELSDIVVHLDEVRNEIQDVRGRVTYDPTVTPAQRAAMLRDLEDLRDEEESLDAQRVDLEIELAKVSEVLEELGIEI